MIPFSELTSRVQREYQRLDKRLGGLQKFIKDKNDFKFVEAKDMVQQNESIWKKNCSKVQKWFKYLENLEKQRPKENDFPQPDITKLMTQSENNCLKFVESASTFLNAGAHGREEFSNSIVSMYNTPHRAESYIILGVSTKSRDFESRLIGLSEQHHKTDEFYQRLFDDSLFSHTPKFTYTEMPYGNKDLGIFTIPVSKEKGPCISTQPGNHLRLRIHSKDVIAGDQEDTQSVYQWFGTPCPQKQERQGPSTNIGNIGCLDKALKQYEGSSNYCLISYCPEVALSEETKANSVAFVPWLKVFDLDMHSKRSGLLSVCGNSIKGNFRPLHETTCLDKPKNLSSDETEWHFPRGCADKPQSCYDDAEECESEVGGSLRKHCEKVEEFCKAISNLVFIVFWYSTDVCTDFLVSLVQNLLLLVPKGKFVFCFEKVPDDQNLKLLLSFPKYKKRVQIIDLLPFSTICEYFANEYDSNPAVSKNQLPTASGKDDRPAEERAKKERWLKSHLEVLYVTTSKVSDGTSGESINELGKKFYRGGILTWDHLKVKKFDADRDLYPELKQAIVQGIQREKHVSVVTVMHAPGSGGSTLARRTLWDVNQSEKAVCTCLSSVRNPNEVIQRIDYLWFTTKLPVVVLADGHDPDIIRHLSADLDNFGPVGTAVIVHIRRTTQTCRPHQLYVSGELSSKEAFDMEKVYSEIAKERKTELRKLCSEVAEGSTKHIYEFGLTAYGWQYFGIIKYVSGHLEIAGNVGEISNWQKVLAYVALSCYYGGKPVPAQFFIDTGLIRSGYNESGECGAGSWKYMDLLPNRAKEFIVCVAHKECEMWKIRYPIIAKEILEQVLSFEKRSSMSEDLSGSARHNLVKFLHHFLNDAKKANFQHRKMAHPIIMDLVRSIFINRESDVGHSTRKPLSKLLQDVPDEHGRLTVFEKLTDTFEDDPMVWAQRGRFLGMSIQCEEDEKKAESCFNQALSCADEQECSDRTYSIIYHMYGKLCSQIFQSHLESYNANLDFHAAVLSYVNLAKNAVAQYMECRQRKAEGEEDTYGYIGEIEIQLCILWFLNEQYCNGFSGYISCNQAETESTHFVLQCVDECQYLLSDCIDKVPEGELVSDFWLFFNHYNNLVKDADWALQELEEGNDHQCRNRRIKNAVLKSKAWKGKHVKMSLLENLEDTSAVQKIVENHENNLLSRHLHAEKSKIEYELREWVNGIRHKLFDKRYSIQHVLQVVQNLPDLPTAIYRHFLEFVLNAILGIGSVSGNVMGRKSYLENAVKRLEAFRKKYRRFSPRLRQKIEWLGIHDQKEGIGIKQLLHKTSFDNHNMVGYWQRQEEQMRLEVRTGTISQINDKNKQRGYIVIDGHHRDPPLKLFFDFRSVEGNADVNLGTRVEFHVGFNLVNWIEAYNIHVSRKVSCQHCKELCCVSKLRNITQQYRKCSHGHVIKYEEASESLIGNNEKESKWLQQGAKPKQPRK